MNKQDKSFCSLLSFLLLLYVGLFSTAVNAQNTRDLLEDSAENQFSLVRPGKKFHFPRDHGAHPSYPVEWWYFTGHLHGVNEERSYGFELTFFRVSINPAEMKSSTNWHTQSLYLAHAALTDDQGKRFLFEKRTSRPAFGKAGASSDKLVVWLDNWRVKQGSALGRETFDLSFNAVDERSGDEFELSLILTSHKAPVLQGDNGYSKKGLKEGDASYYVSLTRLEGEGNLRVGREDTQAVRASVWMDHEILSSQPNNDEVGWDWFALQLSNGWECMLYHLRRGTPLATSPYSSGSCVSPDGVKFPLRLSDYSIKSTGIWRSVETGISYPSGWHIYIKPLDIAIELEPTVLNQELASKQQSTRSYWEGRCLLKGTVQNAAVTGEAYVELVGYKPNEE